MISLNSILKFNQDISFGAISVKASTELPVTDLLVYSIDADGKAEIPRVVLGNMLEISLEEILKVLSYKGITVLERNALYPHQSMRIRDHLIEMLKYVPAVMDEVAVFSAWHKEDILECRADLTDEQVAHVCSALVSNHNAEVGINWDSIKTTIDELFPE